MSCMQYVHFLVQKGDGDVVEVCMTIASGLQFFLTL